MEPFSIELLECGRTFLGFGEILESRDFEYKKVGRSW